MSSLTIPRRSPLRTIKAASDGYAAANLHCAAIILEAPDRFGGPGSLMVLWAQLVMEGEVRGPAPVNRRARLADDGRSA